MSAKRWRIGPKLDRKACVRLHSRNAAHPTLTIASGLIAILDPVV
jgi:hypothetical protein